MAAPTQAGRAFSTNVRSADLHVVWLGERPWWLDAVDARAQLEGVELGSAAVGGVPTVIHARADGLALADRGRLPIEPLVVDLSGAPRLSRPAARLAGHADLVLVSDARELALLRRGRRPSVQELPPPLDLAEHAPAAQLSESRDAELKRFRRLHRLTPRTVLYAGPYTEQGGLHVLVDAIRELRTRYDDLLLAAIPEGTVDRRYRDACERAALSLGHRGVIAWEVDASTRPLWYASATVVCLPYLAPGDPLPARYAAAAGRPVVAADVTPLRAEVEEGRTGFLVPPSDRALLAQRLDVLLAGSDATGELGRAARARAERLLSPANTASRLRTIWSALALHGVASP